MLDADYSVEEDYDLQSQDGKNRLQKRMANFKQHLGQKLQDMGLDISFPLPKNNDPELIVQQEIQQLTSLLIQKTEQVIEDHLNLTELVTKNQETILKYFAGVLSMAQIMIGFSKDLYTSGEHISTFRNFKKLYDEFSDYSVLLNGYHAFTEGFEQTRKRFLVKQQSLLNKIIFKDEQTQPQSQRQNIETQLEILKQQNQQLLVVLRKYEEQLSKYEPYEGENNNEVHKQNLKLMGELDKLQRILNQNNQDFAIQVQRYNRLLYDEREDFKRIQMQLRNDARVLEYSIRQAQKELVMAKQQKYKDQIMIENLIRKNRHLEKRDSFQYASPSHKLNHTVILPNSPKRLGMHSNGYSKNL